jgi:hypothetical protein
MLAKLLSQPTWPVAAATLLAAFGTLILQWGLNRRTRRLDETLRIHSAKLGERNSETAAALADLKQVELTNAATSKWVDIIERRADRLQADLAELLGLLEVFTDRKDDGDRKDLQRMAQLGRAISLTVPPIGKFPEELNIQLGHIREAVAKGPGYFTERPGLLWALQTNAWKIVDAERSRALEAISAGKPIERHDLEPEHWRRMPAPAALPDSPRPT